MVRKRFGVFPASFYRRQERFYESLHRDVPGEELLFINHGFAGAAPLGYRLKPAHRRYRPHAALLSKVLEGADLRGKEVLEIGCGRGGNCLLIAEYMAPASVRGVDRSASGIALCRPLERGRPLSFLRAEAAALPLAGSSVDAVVNIESSHCYADRARFFREVFRVLRPGGQFFYADCMDWRLVPVVRRELERARLARVRETDITRGVVLGLERNRAAFGSTLAAAARGARGRRLAARIMKAVFRGARAEYRDGDGVYFAWRLSKPLRRRS